MKKIFVTVATMFLLTLGVFANSDLVEYTNYSPNYSWGRVYDISRITPHCVVGQCTIEGLGAVFSREARQASSNYGIDKDGRVGLFVDETNRSWCSSSYDNDNRAVTIECASDKTEPYAMNPTVYLKLVELCTDICARNGKTELLWIEDKDEALTYIPKSNEMLLTVHRWFAAKSCPGDWLYNRLGDLASIVTKRLSGMDITVTVTDETKKEEPSTVWEETLPTYDTEEVDQLVFYVTIDFLEVKDAPSWNANDTAWCGGGEYYYIDHVEGNWGHLENYDGWIFMDDSTGSVAFTYSKRDRCWYKTGDPYNKYYR